MFIADAEHKLRTALMEAAAPAIADVLEDGQERLALRYRLLRGRLRFSWFSWFRFSTYWNGHPLSTVQIPNAQVAVELEALPEKISVHRQHAGPGAVLESHRRCDQRPRASLLWQRAAFRLCAERATPRSARTRNRYRCPQRDWPRPCRSSWTPACGEPPAGDFRFRRRNRSASGLLSFVPAQPECREWDRVRARCGPR